MTKVAVMGSGSWGTAFSIVLADAGNDVVQWHLYGKDTYDVHALARTMAKKVAETVQHERPILVGEFGWGGEAAPAHDHTHVGLWSATFSGAGVLAHVAPPFNLDSDGPLTPARGARYGTACCELPGTASYSAYAPRTGPPSPQRATKAVGISPEPSSTSQPSAFSSST